LSPQDIFVTIDPQEAAQVKAEASTTGNRPFSPVTKALLAGDTVFLVARTSYNTKTFTKLGKRLRSHRGERDGKQGVYIWLEDMNSTNGSDPSKF
jgi:hypothetical protein